ncbi:MAG: RNase adapter RapZ [Lachnospiraceae bacterium]
MEFVIITGMSGAGKTQTMKILEDLGYFCVDNLPVQLIPKFTQLANDTSSEITKVAFVIDVRSRKWLEDAGNIIAQIKKDGIDCKILFLDASDECLVKRFKETRRNHPLSQDGRIENGIQKERELLASLKMQADYVIDTSMLLTRELRVNLERIFKYGQDYKNLIVTILSFGFKYGIPTDSDLVFDVRFLPNPYYVAELRPLTGNDVEIQNFVMNSDISKEFLQKLVDMVKFLIPNYVMEGKNQLVISIGCTGGKHRSVTIANALYEQLKGVQESYGIKIEHRDIEKDTHRKGK